MCRELLANQVVFVQNMLCYKPKTVNLFVAALLFSIGTTAVVYPPYSSSRMLHRWPRVFCGDRCSTAAVRCLLYTELLYHNTSKWLGGPVEGTATREQVLLLFTAAVCIHTGAQNTRTTCLLLYRRYAECVNQQQKQNITTIQHHIQVQSALCPLRIYSSTVRVCVWGGVAIQFILDVRLVGRTGRGHTGGRSHRISHPPFFCGACLTFSREKDSVVPFPRRP